MNKILFEKISEQHPEDIIPTNLTLPPKTIPKKEYFGMLELETKKGAKFRWMTSPYDINVEEPKSFHEIFKIFCLESFSTC